MLQKKLFFFGQNQNMNNSKCLAVAFYWEDTTEEGEVVKNSLETSFTNLHSIPKVDGGTTGIGVQKQKMLLPFVEEFKSQVPPRT